MRNAVHVGESKCHSKNLLKVCHATGETLEEAQRRGSFQVLLLRLLMKHIPNVATHVKRSKILADACSKFDSKPEGLRHLLLQESSIRPVHRLILYIVCLSVEQVRCLLEEMRVCPSTKYDADELTALEVAFNWMDENWTGARTREQEAKLEEIRRLLLKAVPKEFRVGTHRLKERRRRLEEYYKKEMEEIEKEEEEIMICKFKLVKEVDEIGAG